LAGPTDKQTNRQTADFTTEIHFAGYRRMRNVKLRPSKKEGLVWATSDGCVCLILLVPYLDSLGIWTWQQFFGLL